MIGITDSAHLRAEQYQDASNVGRRFDLHERFSINSYGWHRWVFDQIEVTDQSRVLELGCGPVYLWTKNIDRIPPGWDITLSDFSPGMLRDARTNLGAHAGRVRFLAADAHDLPFHHETFDLVIANHMLYHVKDRDRAFRDIKRLLRTEGALCAASNGPGHLQELFDLALQFDPARASDGRGNEGFGLQNGGDQLARHFADVSLACYEDGLVITELDGLLGWAESWAPAAYGQERLAEFYAFLTDQFGARSPFRVTKNSGIFTARDPR